MFKKPGPAIWTSAMPGVFRSRGAIASAMALGAIPACLANFSATGVA